MQKYLSQEANVGIKEKIECHSNSRILKHTSSNAKNRKELKKTEHNKRRSTHTETDSMQCEVYN